MVPLRISEFPKGSPRLLGVAVAGAAMGALIVGAASRSCRTGGRVDGLEQRVARVETLLGLADAEAIPSADTPAEAMDGAAPPADERMAACAIAKVTAYRAWQGALGKAKTLAAPAQAACADIWSDKRKQACYYAASAGTRTTQAARDAIMSGDAGAASDAVKNVKDDPKNDAIAQARAASERVLAICRDVDR